MLTDAHWESFEVSKGSILKTALLKHDGHGWHQIAVLMPPGTNFAKDSGPTTCIVEFVTGQAMYKVNGKTCYSRPNITQRISAGELFEISMAFTEVLWILHYPPKLRAV